MKVHWMNYVALAFLFLGSLFLIGLSVEVIDWFAYLMGCSVFTYSVLVTGRILG